MTLRVTPVSPNPDSRVTRSVSDSLAKRQVKSHNAEKTAAAPPFSPPETFNTLVITRMAHEVMDQIEDSPDLPEAVKSRCGQLHILYDSTSVGKAIDSARFQRRRRRG